MEQDQRKGTRALAMWCAFHSQAQEENEHQKRFKKITAAAQDTIIQTFLVNNFCFQGYFKTFEKITVDVMERMYVYLITKNLDNLNATIFW